MLKLITSSTKVLLLALWAACVLSLLSIIPEPYARTVLMVGAIFLRIHCVEDLLVRSKVAERQEGKTGFIGTMVFGFGYWLPVLRLT